MNDTEYPYLQSANLAAVLEKFFGFLYEHSTGGPLDEELFFEAVKKKTGKQDADLTAEDIQACREEAKKLAETYKGYKLVDTRGWENHEFSASPSCKEKALVLKAPDGSLYIHYRGTGDGNWGFNAAVYGTEASKMQEWAVNFYEEALRECDSQGAAPNIYVTGHSQGGHNAQYVTIHAPSANRITACISLDGPGHSFASLEEIRQRDGDYYERQRNKIYAYNGWSDYVSCLGQEQIVPPGHVFYVETRDDPLGGPMTAFHAADFLMDEDNRLGRVHPASENPEQPFRKFVIALNEKILLLEPEKQALVADAIMELCEMYVGASEPYKGELSHFEELKPVLIPILLDVLEEYPELLQQVLEQLRVDSMVFPDSAGEMVISNLVMDLIKELNSLPPDMRKSALEYILRFLVVKEDGKLGLDIDGFREHLISNGLEGLIKVWPIIQDTLINNPADVLNLLRALKVDEMIVNFIKDHPVLTIGIIGLGALILPFIKPVLGFAVSVIALAEAGVAIIKMGYAVFKKISEIVRKAADFAVNCLQWVGNAFHKIGQWFHNTFNAGARYARDYPYFRADTTALRSCADRVRAVNQRLYNLDGDLRGLYWQVGFLDLWDIFSANLLTSGSPTLRQVESWLRDTARTLEDADRKAYRNF